AGGGGGGGGGGAGAGGRAGGRLPPVGERGGQTLAVPARPLPERIVGVLEGERRKRRRRGGAVPRRGIERRELVEQQAERPAVDRYVMERHEQHVLARAQAQQGGAQQPAGREVEGSRR